MIHPDEVQDLDRGARLLADLPPQPGQRVLVLIEEAAERVPEPGIGLVGAPREEDTPAPSTTSAATAGSELA